MWVFYHDITASSQYVSSNASALIGLAVMTGLIVVVPTYFDKKRK
jgi:hypothetical protein